MTTPDFTLTAEAASSQQRMVSRRELEARVARTKTSGLVGVGGASFDAEGVTLYRCDCMELMRRCPDKAFDLAIVDPPYGIGQDVCHTGTKRLKGPMWDAAIPPLEYFDELRRVSCEQIIWGGNYFPLPLSRGWIVWDKRPMPPSYASCELAWTSYDRNAATWSGKTGDDVAVVDRIHPTQKPVKLYAWLLANYAAPGMNVLDTHLGSGGIAIAARNAGCTLTGCEIDAGYLREAIARITRDFAQGFLSLGGGGAELGDENRGTKSAAQTANETISEP